jgi:hypothetical protein
MKRIPSMILIAVALTLGSCDQGMMGGGYRTRPAGDLLGMDQAASAILAYLSSRADANLALDEIIQFANGFYALVKEKDTGKGAFELLVDPYSGEVYGEPGPNMMWNAKYGPMGSWSGFSSAARISPADAEAAIRRYLESRGDSEAYVLDLDEFYGYYTIDIVQDGKVIGMASVDARSGALMYHGWHGDFIAIKK